MGCSNDDVQQNKAFADEQGFGFPLLCDTDLTVAAAYDTAGDGKARRTAVLIDEAGKIAASWDPAGKAEFPAEALAQI